ncbi:MAG: hypothetical protein IH628_01950, partial [Proteobacteria bacterium]|nr:hypothetical protein [Pseudomonadota bacterium]
NTDNLKDALAILNTESGDTDGVKDVDRVSFTEDSRWVLVLMAKEQAKENSKSPKDTAAPKAKKGTGTDLLVRRLGTTQTTTIPFVKSFSVDTLSQFLVYAVEGTIGAGNGLFHRRLEETPGPESPILQAENVRISHLAWNNRTGALAFVAAELDEKEKPKPGAVWIWKPEAKARMIGPVTSGWIVPSVNDLDWSRDGDRLYLGLRPASDTLSKESEEDTTVRLFDVASILKKRELDVWHWDDPLVNSHQKKQWKAKSEQVYRAVYHLEKGSLVQLADTVLEVVSPAENPLWALGSTGLPYQKLITWDGGYADYVLVNQQTGQRRTFLRRHSDRVRFSPDGRFVAFFRDSSWYLYSVNGDSSWNVTGRIDLPFYNEEDDTPSVPGSYGSPGWMVDGSAVLIYDRFDLWSVPTDGAPPRNLTKGEGRNGQLRFRIVNLDPQSAGFAAGDVVHLSAFHDREKFEAVYSLALDSSELRELVAGPH